MKPYILVRLKVHDYDVWRPTFDAHADVREKYGCRGGQIFRTLENPNELFVLMEWHDMDQGRAYATSAELRDGIQRAGLLGPPEMYLLDEVARTER